MFNFSQTIPLSLYIHIPWCVKKCPYCDFNSHQARQAIPEQEYIQALIADLEQDLPKIWGRRITSIFFGGGTPSLFSPAGIETILTEIRARISFAPDIEITLEANPGTVEQSRFEGFYAAGINRLSIGVQSFQENKLKLLGRIHDREAAIRAATAAHAAGFKTFNLDLMFGLPQQTIAEGLADLQQAIDLAPTHISWYQLTLEPNTLFYHKPPTLPHDDVIETLFFQGQVLLAKAGFNQYEVSAYCQASHTCRHNINYWEFGDYLGIGAGAHSKLTDMPQQQAIRMWKAKHPKDYLDPQRPFIAGSQIITAAAMPFEFMLNALRLYQPIALALFEAHAGLSKQVLAEKLALAQAKKLLVVENDQITTTELGRRFLNNVLEIFM